MKKKIVILTVTLLLVLGIVQVAAAAGFGFGGGPYLRGGEKGTMPVNGLNLTDQQVEKMRKLNEEHYAQSRELRIQLMDKMHQLRQLQLQKNPDQAAIEAKKKEITELREKLSGIARQYREQCRALLTEEQLEQLDEFRGKMGCGFGKRFGVAPGAPGKQ